MKPISESRTCRLAVAVVGIVILTGSMTGPVSQTGPDTGTIRGVVKDRFVLRNPAAIYIERTDGGVLQPPETTAVMDQKDLKFVPHVLPVALGTSVDFPNNDGVRHSVFSTKKSTKKFNLGTYDVGVVKKVEFDTPGVTTLLCNVHAEMVAYVITLETPYFTVTDRRGNFSIENVPTGTYSLTMWHERLEKTTSEVTVSAGQTVDVEFSGLKLK